MTHYNLGTHTSRSSKGPARGPVATLGVLAAVYFLYVFALTGTGLIGPDEPRYASIGREMARSGDWITPRLWGEPWFEKPALLYWMTGAAYKLGLGDDLAPRLPVALLGAGFLAFYYAMLKREFGGRSAAYAAAILGGSAGWVAFSYASVTDLPMAACFSAAMLMGLAWMRTNDARWLNGAAAALGLAVLAKGLPPLALAIPFAWHARSRWREMLRWQPIAVFLAAAAPWYVLCYLRHGDAFVRTFFIEHHFGRFTSTSLQHVQPWWFYFPVIVAALFPWSPVYALLARRGFYSDSRRVFLLLWLLWGLLFFSTSVNKLHGYILPLVPAAAALGGIALAEARRARWILTTCALLLCMVFPLAQVLAKALDVGLSRTAYPVPNLLWGLPLILAAAVWRMEPRSRDVATSILTGGLVVAVIYLKLVSLPADSASPRGLAARIAASNRPVCVDEIHRNWRYGLNYYLIEPLRDCGQNPQSLRIVQTNSTPIFIDSSTSK